MIIAQLPLTQHHTNRQLFADYYLNIVLPQRADWKHLASDPAVHATLAHLIAIWQAYTPTDNEAQTERDFIRPVLEALGHTFEVQPSLHTPGGIKRPDYVLYRNEAALKAHKGATLTDELLKHTAIAIADAKYWERPLDTTQKGADGDPFNNKNPSYQIDFYMRHSGTEWGILTNGRLWRLYHQESSKKLDRYYEVDLPNLLDLDDPAAFLYFYAFFHRSAFDDHPLGIAAVRHESTTAAQGISDSIKQQVYTALRHLAQGFLDYTRNELQPDSKTLKTIYDHSLIVLYRMLFILYAEARDLLPLRGNPVYRESYSLYAFARDVVQDITLGRQLLPMLSTRWQHLRELFRVINEGLPPLHVATFNGGLFDPQRYSFLETSNIGDARLHDAIELLTRVDGQFVDYRDLAERHLGTIYEGLLEYHLQPIDPEGYWTIDLFNDNGERKITGSYYTPDFIVEYIVDQTVGPVVQAAIANAPDDAAKIDAVMHTTVLDPSMGSGHFLVVATEYIARFLVDLDVRIENANGETDLTYWKRRVAQTCIYGVDVNPLAVELAKLSLWLTTVAKDKPLSFLDHHMRCGNALVGAQVDNLRPLDSHLRRKHAQRQAQQSADAGQLSMLNDESFRHSMSTAVGSMWLIEYTVGDTVAAVREQERLYESLREQLTRTYGMLANLVTATSFGLEVAPSFWKPLYDYTTGRLMTLPTKLEEIIIAADRAAREQHFFHWELEFPEIFFDKHGQSLGDTAGFDAVIGNPPYVRQHALALFKPYFGIHYADVYQGGADLYVYFYQRGVHLLRPGGRMSYIVTNKWLRAGYGEPLRGYFAGNTAIEQIIDFGHAPIFPEADVFPCIVVLTKPDDTTTPANQQVQMTNFPRNMLGKTTLKEYVAKHSYHIPQQRFTSAAWSLETSDVDTLMAKIRARGVPLTEFAGVKSYSGIITGLNEAFLIDTPTRNQLVQADPACAAIMKPYLRGQDIKRWAPEWAGLWMIVMKSSNNHTWPWSGTAERDAEATFQQTYPSVYAHMKPLEQRLRQRKSQWYYWWELYSCTYYDLFEQPKILYQEIQFHSRFAYDDASYLSNNKVFLLPKADLYILAVLNSPIMWWHNWRYLPHMKDEALNLAIFLMEHVPIAVPTDDTRAEVEQAIQRLIAITQATQEARRTMHDWLRVEFAIEKPGQKLDDFASLSADEFVAEVRKRRPKTAGQLRATTMKAVREEYQEQAIPVQQLRTEAQQLERRISDLVNAAYGLTPDEVDLLWRTAPPRMPVS